MEPPTPTEPVTTLVVEPDDPAAPSPAQPPKPKKRHRWLKILIATVVGILLVLGAAYWWLFYFRHFNFGHRGGDIGMFKAGIFEGTMNHFAPAMESDDATVYLNRQIFEGLVIFEGQTRISPNLVTGWTNPDDKTWIFTLKPGVKFHNGDTLTAKDVVYSYEQYKQNDGFGYVTETIASVEAVSDSQVKFTTKTVDPVLINRLVDLFIIDSKANGRADPQYGTGPYMLKPGTQATTKHIELTAFDAYHGGKPHTRAVQVTVYGEEEQDAVTKAFILGKLNLVAFVPSSAVDTAKALHFQAGSRDDPAVYQLVLNTNKAGSPLTKLKVRQAIYKTIDVAALLKAIGRDRTGQQADQILAASIPGYNPEIKRPTLDLPAARQLLKEAGYPNGTDITLTVFSGAKDAGDELVRQLAPVGIRVTLNVRDDVDGIQADAAAGKLESFYYAEGTSLLDGSDVFSKMIQETNYRNPTVNDLQTQANSTLNATDHLNALKQISKLFADDVPSVPLYTNRNQWIMDRAYSVPEDTLVSGLGVYLYKIQLP